MKYQETYCGTDHPLLRVFSSRPALSSRTEDQTNGMQDQRSALFSILAAKGRPFPTPLPLGRRSSGHKKISTFVSMTSNWSEIASIEAGDAGFARRISEIRSLA